MNSLIWFRQDLRISDNPALCEAFKNSDKVAAIYIHDEETKGVRKMGSASKWWLHYALEDLSKSLKDNYGIELYIFEGKAQPILEKLVKENNIDAIYWNRLYEPYHIDRDKKIKNEIGVDCFLFNASLLNEPWEIKNGAGSYYKVFTSYYKFCLASRKPREALKAPKFRGKRLEVRGNGLNLSELKLLPTKPNWAKGFYKYWPNMDN